MSSEVRVLDPGVSAPQPSGESRSPLPKQMQPNGVMTVASCCGTSIRTVSSKSSLRAAAEQMDKEQVGLLLVRDGGLRSLGVLTDRDLVLHLADATQDPENSRVAEAMTKPAVEIHRNAVLGEAMALMRIKGIRRLPVVDPHDPGIGILAVDDLVRLIAIETSALSAAAAAQLPGAGSISDAARPSGDAHSRTAEPYIREAVSVSAESTLAHVATQMKERCVGCVVVVDSAGEAVGILTDRDLALRGVASGRPLATTLASAIMSSPLVSGEREPLAKILEKMKTSGVRQIPILKQRRPVGMVTLDDSLVGLGRELAQLGGVIARGRRNERRKVQVERARAELAKQLERLTETAGRVGGTTRRAVARGVEALRKRLRQARGQV